jgi:pantothenate synthetase
LVECVEDLLDDMATPASIAVGEVLRQPDDLAKLAAFRNKLLKEKSALDAKLSAGVKAQLDATRDALLKLQASRAAVALIREEMMAVERLKGEEDTGEAFDKITRVSAGSGSSSGLDGRRGWGSSRKWR